MFYYNEEDYYAAQDERVATDVESCREYARNVGMDRPNNAWICTPQDTWERNPFYQGPPCPHPESDEAYQEMWEDDMIVAQDVIEIGGPSFNYFETYTPSDEIPY